VVDGVPVLFPDGRVPETQYEDELQPRGDYFPWIHRVVLQSLLDDQVVLEIGSGNMVIDDPCIVRMDVCLTPHVDVVGDAHHLPFREGVFDFVFSLAVFEHLRQPFEAANEIRRILKDGGYTYNECNFVFAYHGYPAHFFNASVQGLEEVFTRFRRLRTGVAPYQMPSFALQMVLLKYLQHSTAAQHPEARPFSLLLEQVLEEDLIHYDRYFTEAGASNIAAGVFFFGLKQDTPSSTVLPAPVQRAWEASSSLGERFPDPLDLGRADNLLRWARLEGQTDPGVAEYMAGLTPFHKRGPSHPFDRSAIRNMPAVEPRFAVLYDYPANAPAPKKRPRGALRARLQAALRRAANRLDRY
jgi:SAM-dependent methyltransferase